MCPFPAGGDGEWFPCKCLQYLGPDGSFQVNPLPKTERISGECCVFVTVVCGYIHTPFVGWSCFIQTERRKLTWTECWRKTQDEMYFSKHSTKTLDKIQFWVKRVWIKRGPPCTCSTSVLSVGAVASLSLVILNVCMVYEKASLETPHKWTCSPLEVGCEFCDDIRCRK